MRPERKADVATNKLTAAIVGGGVIGGGWAARFLLHGHDVVLFDQDPECESKTQVVLDNARQAVPGLYDTDLPQEGRFRVASTLEDAVAKADWIQESVPERLEIKHAVYQQIDEHAPVTALLGSSTSGFRPTQLQEGSARPERLFVAHPFNPVYLLPLVEIVGGEASDEQLLQHAAQVLESIGMKPLRVQREIDAHIADRLLEAVWREALWLVRDGVATTSDIDDAIRYGFGLRWAQMGLFETYRIAGGQGGMAHFLAQFGPCLQWPWTKLTDVPELTDELIQTIADQSDQQSGEHSITELERMRDRNLVGIMRALKQSDWAAGALLNQHDEHLRATDTREHDKG